MPVVDLFCGCGGLSKGFELAGFNIVASFDSWQPALTCYNANFTHEAHNLDLNNVTNSIQTIQEYHPSIIIGGPPCQEFSNAGPRQEGPLADLTYKYAQIITAILPQYFVMENVPRARESKAYAKARALYKEHQYGLTEVVLDASRCGAPQNRNRFFCVGALNTDDNFLLESIFKEYTGTPVTVRQYFDAHNIELNIDAYYRHPTTYSRRGIFKVDEVAPTIRGVNRPKPPKYKRHKNDAVPLEELEGINKLSLRERATIQTFPQNFNLEGLGISQCDLEQMIGNAVPVTLARFVAERLHAYIQQRENGAMDTRQAFSAWLRAEKGYSDRSISDVFSRLKRAQEILPNQAINEYFIVDLQKQDAYKALTTSVKSQIRIAIKLKLAFTEQLNDQRM